MVLLSMIYVKTKMGQGKMYKCELNSKSLEIPTIEDVIGDFLEFGFTLVNYLNSIGGRLYNFLRENISVRTENTLGVPVSNTTKS